MAAVTAASGAVVRTGHLRKLKTMKKKFFVLRGDSSECSARLEYYESEKKYKAGATSRRALPLRSCFNITRRLDLKQKHVIALFTKEEQFCVVAESESDLHEWLNALLRLHRADDQSDQITHPIQHVWQVNVQKKGLGASKNIQGLYNLCLTDKTLTLVKIKSHNNVISELGIPERVEYSLKNIRRCGDSECFFYMEVGRQTVTGAGELWMLADDSNIAQSMHSTIYHAMRNCAKESENERDHIVLPGKGTLDFSQPPPARRQTYSDGSGRAGLMNERGLCLCIKQCVCQSGTTSIDDSAQPMPLTNNHSSDAGPASGRRGGAAAHQRTASLPAALPGGAGGAPPPGGAPHWARRASTGTRFSKLSPAHTKTAAAPRLRCDSVPARPPADDRRPPGPPGLAGEGEVSRDEADGEWSRTPRIPEEPDGYLPMAPSSNSVCSGTPSTHARFCDYPLEPATSLLGEQRAARAYSVGSRPAPRASHRHRAYSAGARPPPPDLMELDFTVQGSPSSPAPALRCERRRDVDEYVDMSPRLHPLHAPHPPAAAAATAAATDGYVEMSYGKARAESGGGSERSDKSDRSDSRCTPHGSQTIFPFSPDDDAPHPLTTLSEISEDNSGPGARRRSPPPACAAVAPPPGAGPAPCPAPAPGSSPAGYVRLASPPAAGPDTPKVPDTTGPGALTATVVVSGTNPLHYAALDLEPRRVAAAPPPRHYTRIDFVRSEQLRADHAH